MKKILYVLFAVMTCLFVTGLVKADGPSYEIQSYRGTLILETWDDATYEEELVYHLQLPIMVNMSPWDQRVKCLKVLK